MEARVMTFVTRCTLTAVNSAEEVPVYLNDKLILLIDCDLLIKLAKLQHTYVPFRCKPVQYNKYCTMMFMSDEPNKI